MNLARNSRQLGNIIRRARKAKGWNQSQLGENAGVGQDTVSLLETGNSSANLDTILAVLAALDLEIRVAARTKSGGADIENLF